jgi:outer membrane lipoprotein carrier protein
MTSAMIKAEMKPVFLLLIGLLWMASVPSADALESAQSTSKIVKKIQDQYQATHSLEADFIQVNHYEGFTNTFTSKGRLYIKRPGKLRWDYLEPIKEQVFVNENKVWVYIPEHKQVVLSRLAQENDSQLPIHLLSWVAQLDKEFNIHPEKEAAPETDGETVSTLTLIPKEGRGGPQKITLEVDSKTNLIHKITLHEANGNTAAFTFSQIKTNQGLEDRWFVFTPPKDVEVVEPPPLSR